MLSLRSEESPPYIFLSASYGPSRDRSFRLEKERVCLTQLQLSSNLRKKGWLRCKTSFAAHVASGAV